MKSKILKSISLSALFLISLLAGCLDSVTPPNSEDIDGNETLIIAYEVKDDYDNPDENPQILADYLSEELDMEVLSPAAIAEKRVPIV